MKDIEDNITNTPRIGALADFFEKTALGELGKPDNTYLGDINLFKNDEKMLFFYLNHRKLQGQFDKHFYSSIPFILEEECRVGSALKDYLEKREGTQYLYVLGAAEGTMARTIGNLSNGKIKTLSCSPTKANQDNFFRYGKPLHSKFILSPYNKINNSNIRELLPNFNGFDVIIEDTTFQMYSPDRAKQVKFTKEKLKNDGIIGFIEKFSNKDITEFLKREHIKDSLFKNRFFSQKAIRLKKENVLTDMNNCLVTIDTFKNILANFFKYAVINWNSGNFYTVYASNSKNNLLSFLSNMTPALTPSKFVHTKLPVPLLNLNEDDIKYRVVKEK